MGYSILMKNNIAHQIQSLRKKRNLTQIELAKKIKSSQSQITRLENPDYSAYTIKVLRKVAKALNADLKISLNEKR